MDAKSTRRCIPDVNSTVTYLVDIAVASPYTMVQAVVRTGSIRGLGRCILCVVVPPIGCVKCCDFPPGSIGSHLGYPVYMQNSAITGANIVCAKASIVSVQKNVYRE